MPLRVLILRSNPVHSDPRVDKIARTLGSAGYSVHVLGWDFTGKHSPQEQRDGYTLQRLHLPVAFGRGLQNLGHELRWQLKLLGWLRRQRESFDILHACDFDTVLPALMIGRWFHKQIIYDIFDFYADMLRQTPALVKQAIRQVDLWLINRVDGVILADDSRYDQIAGADPRRSVVIYNSPEDQAPPEPIPSGSPPGELVLAYIGLLQSERGLFELIDVIADHPAWRLELGGSGAEAEALVADAGRISDFRFHGRLPYDQALALNACADVLIATFDPAIPNHKYSSSNKLFEAMMLGKPIIVARHTNMDRLVESHQCGLVVTYGDRAELAKALERFSNDVAFRKQCGRNARAAYEQAYSWRAMQHRLLDFYQAVTTS
jgi:glycosyltransferase involved in cell wall biosynthesis